MAETFRKKFRNAVLLGILGIGLIAIVVTGFGTDGMGGLGGLGGAQQAQTLARIGDEKLTDRDLASDIDRFYRQAAQSQPTLDRADFVNRYFDDILARAIEQKAIADFALNAGFVVSDVMIDRVIAEQFQSMTGGFDEAAYQDALRRMGTTSAELRENIRDSMLAQMLVAPVGSQGRVPQAVAREYASLMLERRQGSLGAVPTAAIATTINPSDQEIARFYQQNQRSFAIPERRVIRFALLDRNSFGDRVRATDQEIAQYYQQNQAQYGPTEMRSLQRVILPDENAARQFVQQVRGGTAFSQAAQRLGFAAGDINFPNQTRQQFATASTPEVANAAFTAQQGAVLGPFRTDLGFQVVRVEGISQTPGRPLETVRAEITAAIEQRKLSEALIEAEERIQERLDGGESFEEIARAERLNVQTSPPVTRTGEAPGVQGPNGQPFQFPPDLGPLLQTAFEMEPESDPLIEVVQPNARVAVVAVANVIPSAAPPLAQIRDQVRARLIQQTALQRARQIADGIAQRINSGITPAQAYAQAGITLQAPENVTLTRLQVSRPGQQVPPPLVVLFAIPQGRARVMAAPNNSGWIIVHHVQRTPGNVTSAPNAGQIVSNMQNDLGSTVSTELQEQFARAVTATVNVRRDEQRIGALRQQLSTGQ